jgi:LPXTG-motif cell wall-anchored protein
MIVVTLRRILMMSKSTLRLAATAVAIACAASADAQQANTQQPNVLPNAATWMPLLVVFGLLALVGALLLMTRRKVRPSPWESDEMEASTARAREMRLAELKPALAVPK